MPRRLPIWLVTLVQSEVQPEEIANLIVQPSGRGIELIDEGLLEVSGRKAGEKPARLKLHRHNGRRFERLQKPARQSHGDAVLDPASPAASHAELENTRLREQFRPVQELLKFCERLVVALELAGIDVAGSDPVLERYVPRPSRLEGRAGRDGIDLRGVAMRDLDGDRPVVEQIFLERFERLAETLVDQHPLEARAIHD